jgi:TolA-binding protein
VVGVLRDYQPAPLGPVADRRILGNLVASRIAEAKTARTPGRLWWAVPAAAVAVAAILFGAARLRHGTPVVAPSEGARFEARDEGSLAFAGALVRYRPGTALEFHPAARTLGLLEGEVEIDVEAGGNGRFRVAAPRFTVEVLGTRFVVTMQGVRTLRGMVRVLDRDERELAVVRAGEAWTLPAAPVSAPVAAAEHRAPPAPPGAAPAMEPVAAVEPAVTARPAPRSTRLAAARAPDTWGSPAATPSPAELLGRAKKALADGDARSARSLADLVLRSSAAERDVAAASQLLADVRLVESRPEEAIGIYRDVARRHAHTPEGETALFAAGQLLVERGRPAEAAATFHEYLARYPMGRFVREVRERLDQVRPAD